MTLIELLVVVAIVALLIAIVAPSLLAAKSQARAVKCCSNQRQLSLAFTVYQDQADVLPYGFNDIGLGTTMGTPPEGYAGKASSDFQGWWWFNYLQNVVTLSQKPGSILWCPGRSLADPKIKSNVLCENYGVNRSICKNGKGAYFSDEQPLRFTQIRNPARTFLLGDSGYSLVSWKTAVKSAAAVYENPSRVNSFYVPGLSVNQDRNELASKTDATHGRHPARKINLLFTDGHGETRNVEFLALKQNEDYPASAWAP